jgi:PhnB protein
VSAKPIPEGYRTITPYLTLNNAAEAIDFYKRAFGAQEIMRMDAMPGKIGHAELKIGDSMIMLADEMPGCGTQAPHSLGGTTASIFLYVENVDAMFAQAETAGAKVEMPPADMFWGDRFGRVSDPYGHLWAIATHVEDVAPEEMGRCAQEVMAKMAQSG